MLKKWEIEKIEQKKNAFGTKFRLSLKTSIFGTKKKVVPQIKFKYF